MITELCRYLVVAGLEWSCWVLDRIPGRSGGHWTRYGDWGCRIGLAYRSARLEDRWDTGFWGEVRKRDSS